uniref:Uncharacterized protein n=1 Tax=Gadus morhua TaxID=8049 RepID=A0A8C5FPS6_GADMO
VGQHTLLHGEALLVVTATDAHHVTLGIGQEGKVSYLLLDLYRLELIRKVRSLRSSSTSISFWQPVAGNEMLSCKGKNTSGF